jgi:hypothetical protein
MKCLRLASLVAVALVATHSGAKSSLASIHAVKAVLSDSDNSDLSDNTLVSSSDFFTHSGNDVGSDLATTLGLLQTEFGGTGWAHLGTSDLADPSPFVGNVLTSTGYLLIDDPPGSLDGPLAITLKAGNDYVAFYFPSVVDVVAFLFDTQDAGLVNGSGIGKGLSHSASFLRNDPITNGNVPEPSSIFVFGLLGLIGSALAMCGKLTVSMPLTS